MANIPDWPMCNDVCNLAQQKAIAHGKTWDTCGQIIAGDEIELVFGARMGLSTLAAAGLGNLVSDIAGLGFANQIEVSISAE